MSQYKQRLWDMMQSKGIWVYYGPNARMPYPRQRLAKADPTFVVADNVWDYLTAEGIENGRAKKTMTLDDFPNIAPPWEQFWIEWHEEHRNGMSGALFTAIEIEEDLPEAVRDLTIPDQFRDARWLYMIEQFTLVNGTIEATPVMIMVGVSHDGTLHKNGILMAPLDAHEPALRAMRAWESAMSNNMIDQFGGLVQDNLVGGLWCPLMALTFTHCRNTEVRKAKPGEVKKVRRAKKGKPLPEYAYHVLEVEPIKRILQSEGGSGESGIGHALHICRGHFKDYRQRGLFGQHKGIYFWGEQVRGTQNRIVEKSYKIGEQ